MLILDDFRDLNHHGWVHPMTSQILRHTRSGSMYPQVNYCNMAMGNEPFEDVSPIEHGHFPLQSECS